MKVFKRLEGVLNYTTGTFDSKFYANLCFKPKQIQCFEFLFNGHDVISVLPTGYG